MNNEQVQVENLEKQTTQHSVDETELSEEYLETIAGGSAGEDCVRYPYIKIRPEA
jgi:hypothetical protein